MRTSDRDDASESFVDSAGSLAVRVDSVVQQYMRSKHAVGLAVGVVTPTGAGGAGTESQSFFFGSAGRDPSAAPNENTLFEIGSITKVFTTTLLADMHLKNEVHLDDPVNTHLPATAKVPVRDGIDVTLRHLATHTSGLPRLPENLDGAKLDAANPYAHYTIDDLYACLAKCRLRNKPGTTTEYSNLGTGLLGHILASVAGTDYETLVKQRICTPLGMTDTTIQLSEEQRQRLAVGHSGGKPVSNWDLPTLAGAGGLRSTLRDMLRFLRANIDPAATPLKAALELAHEIQVEGKYRIDRDWGCMAPLAMAGLSGLFAWQSFGLPVWLRVAAVLVLPVVLFYLWPVGLSTMTLGWHVDEQWPDTPALWHNGATGGYASYLAFLPKTRQGVVLLANSDAEPDSIGDELLRGLTSKAD